MENPGAALRFRAQSWNLEGDRQLLSILQQMHQNMMERVQDTSTRLDAIMSTISHASVTIQNVNNSLMALSNSQFIESRVYDDDASVGAAANVVAKEEPAPPSKSTLSISALADSVKVFQEHFEEVIILADSDSGSASEDDDDKERVVLLPKNRYSERPLPHVIGSNSWRSKWHAGLIEEDSDSSVCERDRLATYQSDSEEFTQQPSLWAINAQHQESITSEDVAPVSDEEPAVDTEPIVENFPEVKQTQSEFAAELARRLGGQLPTLEKMEVVVQRPAPGGAAVKHMFSDKVHQHRVSANVFPDEPPPLAPSSDDDDIFAELLHAGRPAGHLLEVDSDVFDDLRLGSGVQRQHPAQTASAVDASRERAAEAAVKKPMGAVSLFGSTKGGDSVGAAILKRAKKQLSSSDEEEQVVDRPPETEKKKVTAKNDVFSDIFIKAGNQKKVSLEDDMFDDIDDIFATDVIPNVPIKEAATKKSIFDDMDDLFADIDIVTSKKETVDVIKSDKKDTKVKKSIFDDDDDDLFSVTDKKSGEEVENKKTQVEPDNDFFVDTAKGDINRNSHNDLVNKTANNQLVIEVINNKEIIKDQQSTIENPKSVSLFDDEDDDDLFINMANKSKPSQFNNTVDNRPLIDEMIDNSYEGRNNENGKKYIAKEPVEQIVAADIFGQADESIYTKADDNLKLSDKDDLVTSVHVEDDIEAFNQSNVEQEVKNVSTVDGSKRESNTIVEPAELKDKETVLVQNKDKVEKQATLNESKPDMLFKTQKEYSDDIFKVNVNNSEESNDLLNIPKDEKAATITSKNYNNEKESTKENSPIFESTRGLHNIFKDNSNVTQPCDTFSNEKDDFDSIFNDLPPAFEKQKETKKSKNVNALFDDDSDDETLFFKKNDILEDKPEIFSPKIEEVNPTFGIYHDEPPSLDISNDVVSELAPKPTISKESIINTVEADDLFNPNIITTNVGLEKNNIAVKEVSVIEDIPNTTEEVEVISEEKIKSKENVSKALFKEFEPFADQTDGTQNKEVEVRKTIGKVKSSININVSSLLPGASPKKTAKNNEAHLRKDTNNTLEAATVSKQEIHTLVKSVSFEDTPDSPKLCNKFSKERARIQVKRRPSTRIARISALNTVNTDTDLVKSVDISDGPSVIENIDKNSSVNTLGNIYTDVKTKETEVDIEKASNLSAAKSQIIEKETRSDNSVKKYDQHDNVEPDILNIASDIPVAKPRTIEKETKASTEPDNDTNTGIVQYNKAVPHKSKQLIIADDDNEDDIFKTFAPKPVVVDSDEDDIFKDFAQSSSSSITLKKKDTAPTKPQDTNLIKEEKAMTKPTPTKASISLFDDSSDEELFGSKPPAKKSSKTIAEAPENDIFVTKKQMRLDDEVTNNDVPKKSLFGDDSDEDLFGNKSQTTSKKETQPKELMQQKSLPQSKSEEVFYDPLSMLGAEEE